MLLPRSLRYAILSCVLTLPIISRAQTPLAIYTDSLVNNWNDWSWNTTRNFSYNGAYVHAGSNSISATITSGYSALSFEHDGFDSSAYTNLTFWINGGASGGQKLQVYAELTTSGGGAAGATISLPTLAANSWQQITLSLTTLGVANQPNFTRFSIQDRSGAAEPTFYVDDIQLTAKPPPALIHVSVNASQTLRTADARWFGLNTAIWDSYFDTTYTSNALSELGTRILRFPGGSAADDYHWASPPNYDPTTFTDFIHIATNAGAQAVITVNYGSGTPQEAAAWVSNANVINHCQFKYWEIGNECYGTWEEDSNTYPHDPYTYAVRAAQYIAQMKAIDPTIKIGVPSTPGEDNNSNGYTNFPAYNSRTGTYHYGWTAVVLATLKSLGATPDFLVHHVYPEYQADSDPTLLQAATNWASDAADLRQQISDYFGPGGTNIELLCTENNSDAGDQGRQSTSIVNGLYLADSLAQLMKTEFNSFIWWDLRNGQDTSGDFNPLLYGWRTYGDLGIIGNANTRYPTFYTFKLMQYFAQPGDTVLNATSDYALLSTYATRKADGAIALLVINKSSFTNLNAQITLTNFFPGATATARSFGITQDEATRTNSIVPGAQDIATNAIAAVGSIFTNQFPPYSVTLVTLEPSAPQLAVLPANVAGQFLFQLQGQSSVRYVIESSTNLTDWVPVATNTLPTATWNFTNSTASSPAAFWRAVWRP